MTEWFDKQYWNCCKRDDQKGYAGTAILIRRDFEGGYPERVEYDFGEKGLHDQEGRTITCYFKQFILVVTYVPNSGIEGNKLKRLDYRLNSWDVDFHAYIKQLQQSHTKPIIIAGDLNVVHQEIDIRRPKAHHKKAGFTKRERHSFDTFLKASDIVDSFRHMHPDSIKYSYFSARGKWRETNDGLRADYFLVSI